MKIMLWIIGGLTLSFVSLAIYARFAPVLISDWHVQPDVSEPETLEGGYKTKVILTGVMNNVKSQLREIALATPRTGILSEDAELVTFITRSALFGFPDLTTVAFAQDGADVHLQIYARLKIGKADLGVNKKRVEDWLTRLEQR